MSPSLKQAVWTLFSLSIAFSLFNVPNQLTPSIFKPPLELKLTADDLICLTDNIYHEARGEPLEGKVAVAQVTLNRARLQKRSVCAIVYQPGQFSWVNKAKAVAQNSPVWLDAKLVALGVLRGQYYIADLAHATFYHATHVQPYWSRVRSYIMEIGRHRFYA